MHLPGVHVLREEEAEGRKEEEVMAKRITLYVQDDVAALIEARQCAGRSASQTVALALARYDEIGRRGVNLFTPLQWAQLADALDGWVCHDASTLDVALKIEAERRLSDGVLLSHVQTLNHAEAVAAVDVLERLWAVRESERRASEEQGEAS